MVLGLNALCDTNIDKLLSDPPLIRKVLAPDEPEFYEQERKSKTPSGFFTNLFKKNKNIGRRVLNECIETARNRQKVAEEDRKKIIDQYEELRKRTI